VKGAPGTILQSCSRWADGETSHALDDTTRTSLEEHNHRMAARGLRVIALASGDSDRLEDLTFLALVGIADPPRKGCWRRSRCCARRESARS
jgi:magnesium-transporting ATPase (P-type)